MTCICLFGWCGNRVSRVLFVGPSFSWIMARFSAITSDSSDDEQTPYTSQDAHKQPPGSPSRSVNMDQDPQSSGSEEDEDIEVDEEEEDDEEDESEDTSDMDEDDLAVEKAPAPRSRNHALVEDSDGEIQYKHTRSRSESSTSSDSDSEDARQGTTVASWAGRVGIDAQKMHVMQTSLFRMPEEAAALQAMNQPIRPRFKLSPTVSRKHSRDSVGDGRLDSQEVRGSFSLLFLRLTTASREFRSLTTSIIPSTDHLASMHGSTYPPPL